MSREAQRAETRERLLSTAMSVLDDDPSATMAEIARAAGFAKGTVFHHFVTREALIDAVRERWDLGLQERLMPRLAAIDPFLAAEDPASVIQALAEETLAAWAQHRGLIECFVRRAGHARPVETVQDGLSPTLGAVLLEVLAELAAALDAPLARPDLVAHGLLGLWTRVGLHYLFRDDVTRGEAIDVLTRMTLGALRGVLPLRAAGGGE